MKRYFRQRPTRTQAGDTIVEVLIAIAIVSVILVGAFLVSNHSTLAVRDSEEHSEAQQYLQSQVEQLRAYLQTKGNSVPTSFCFDGVTQAPKVVPGNNPKICPLPPSASFSYYPVITTTAGSNLYHCTITWDSIQGGSAEEDFWYRVYPAS